MNGCLPSVKGINSESLGHPNYRRLLHGRTSYGYLHVGGQMTFIIGVTLFLLGIISWMVADVHQERANHSLAWSFLVLAGGLICQAGYLFWGMVR